MIATGWRQADRPDRPDPGGRTTTAAAPGETALAVAEELVRARVDVVIVSSTLNALAAKQATTTVPIVMTVPADPVATELVASLARPGGT